MPFVGTTQLKYVGGGELATYTPVGLRQGGGVILSVCPFMCVPVCVTTPSVTGNVHGWLNGVELSDGNLV